MKEQVNFSRFCDAFRVYNRDNNFSYEGKKALFEWLQEYEDSTGKEMELDVIAICCDFNEWESLEEFQKDHSDDYQSIEDIEKATIVIPIDDDKFITQAF